MAGVDHVVMGRSTYQKVLTFGEWPYADKRVIVLGSRSFAIDARVTAARSLEECITLLEQGDAQGVTSTAERRSDRALQQA